MCENTLASDKPILEYIQEIYNQAGRKNIPVEITGIPYQEMGGSQNVQSISLHTLSKLDGIYIGQTVHYYDHYHHQRAAIITAVYRDKSICDLCVLYPTRQDFIQLVKHDSDHEKETWDFI